MLSVAAATESGYTYSVMVVSPPVLLGKNPEIRCCVYCVMIAPISNDISATSMRWKKEYPTEDSFFLSFPPAPPIAPFFLLSKSLASSNFCN